MKQIFFLFFFLSSINIYAQKSNFGVSMKYSNAYTGNFYADQNEIVNFDKLSLNNKKIFNIGVNYFSLGAKDDSRFFIRHGLGSYFSVSLKDKQAIDTHKTSFYINNGVGIKALNLAKIILQFQIENNFLISSNSVSEGDFSKLNRSFWSIGSGIQPFPKTSKIVLKYDLSFTPVSKMNGQMNNRIYFSSFGLDYNF